MNNKNRRCIEMFTEITWLQAEEAHKRGTEVFALRTNDSRSLPLIHDENGTVKEIGDHASTKMPAEIVKTTRDPYDVGRGDYGITQRWCRVKSTDAQQLFTIGGDFSSKEPELFVNGKLSIYALHEYANTAYLWKEKDMA